MRNHEKHKNEVATSNHSQLPKTYDQAIPEFYIFNLSQFQNLSSIMIKCFWRFLMLIATFLTNPFHYFYIISTPPYFICSIKTTQQYSLLTTSFSLAQPTENQQVVQKAKNYEKEQQPTLKIPVNNRCGTHIQINIKYKIKVMIIQIKIKIKKILSTCAPYANLSKKSSKPLMYIANTILRSKSKQQPNLLRNQIKINICPQNIITIPQSTQIMIIQYANLYKNLSNHSQKSHSNTKIR